MPRPRLQELGLLAWLLRRLLRTGRPPARTLAERLGNIPLRGAPVFAPVDIHWNAHQIPSIEAANDHDLGVGLGVVHAQLRLAQMETMRRLAAGRVAELVGPAAIRLDHSLRLMRFGAAVPQMRAMLPEASRRWAEAFLAGVNHHIAHAPDLPYEFRMLAFRPTPWTLDDLLLISRLAATDVSWLVFTRLLQGHERIGREEWAALWPLLQGGDTVPFPETTPEAALGLIRGSNSAVVAASRSASGAGMIASDPHLSITLPPLFLTAALHAPGLDAVGLMIPGLPVIALGRNEHLAWGGTSLHAASSDLIDVSREPITAHAEVIEVRGRPPVTVTIRETRFGPVVSDGILLHASRPLALRWVGHAPTDEMTAMLGVLRARDLGGFRSALAGFAVPGQTMLAVEAGEQGRTARVIAAHLPNRPNRPMDGLILAPEDAWSLDNLLRAAEFPLSEAEGGQTADGSLPDGIAVSANDRPQSTPVPVGFFFSPPIRVRRLRALLDTDAPVTRERMRALQRDVMQPTALAVRDRLLPRLRPSAGQRRVVQVLADWDGSYDTGSQGALVFEALAGSLARRMLPKPQLALLSAIWTGRTLMAQRTIEAPPRILQAALGDAVTALRRWHDWGGAHRLSLRHPLAALPGVGRWFAGTEHPAPGGNDTLDKSGHAPVRGRHRVTYGACARHVSDLSDPDANWFVLQGGQDGWIGSSTATDQGELWRAGEMIQMPLRAAPARAAAILTTLLPSDAERASDAAPASSA